MQSRTVALLVVFGLLAIFVALNWDAFMAPTSIWLGVASVQAPLGLILLAVIALLSAMFLAYAIYLQAGAMLEARRQAREIGTLREQIEGLRTRIDEGHSKVLERLDRLDADFGGALERTEAAMAAYVGELDDRLERAGARSSDAPGQA